MTTHPTQNVITLDGPSGTGKGTLCHRLAHALGWHALDSGAIYRVLAYASEQQGIPDMAIEALVTCAKHLALRFECTETAERQVYWAEQNITTAIRAEACGQRASKIAAWPEVREALLVRQRAFAKAPGLVTDGRDMGTVVFPDAFLKIYLDASQEARAMRRYLQLKASGNCVSLARVSEELEQRDARDRERSIAPLKPAVDAVIVDTTDRSVDEVFDVLRHILSTRMC